MGKIFIKGLDKDNQKDGLFRGLENIKDKNEELLNAFSATNKAKNESDFSCESKYAFYRFDRDFFFFLKKRRISLGFKYNEMNDFYALLNTFIDTHEAPLLKQKIVKTDL